MGRETIKNWSGQILAYLDTDNEGEQTLRDYGGKILGYYKPRQNVTQTYSGTILSYGNTLSMLIKNPNMKQEDLKTSEWVHSPDPQKISKQPVYGDQPGALGVVLLALCPPLYVIVRPFFHLVNRYPVLAVPIAVVLTLMACFVGFVFYKNTHRFL